MIKKILFIPLLLSSLVACSTNSMIDKLMLSPANSANAIYKKLKRSQRAALPEGIISVDITSDNNRLHLLTGKHQQGKQSLWYQQSDDGGKTWSLANKILNDDNIPAKITRGNDAQITAQNENIVVAWTKYATSSSFNSGAMLAARSNDNGQTWQYTATPPDWKKGPHAYIDLASDQHAMYAVWLDSRTGRSTVKASQGLRYARSINGGVNWQTNQTLDHLTCSCCWNTINADGKGNVFVLYRDKQPSDLSIGVVNTQQQWQRLNHVGAFNWQFDGCPHIGGGFDFQTTLGQHRLHAIVGTGHPKNLGIHYAYSDDAGKNWSPTMQLGNESAIHADIAAHDNGRVIAVWDMMGEGGLAVFVAESIDQGKHWSKPRQLSTKNMRATHPNIIKTNKGFLAVWTENNGKYQSLAKKIL